MTDELPSEHWVYTICATKTHTIKTADCPWCLVAQLRGNLSLAEEGLANYQQENGQLRQTLREILEELQLDDSRHDLQAKIISTPGFNGEGSREPQSGLPSDKA